MRRSKKKSAALDEIESAEDVKSPGTIQSVSDLENALFEESVKNLDTESEIEIEVPINRKLSTININTVLTTLQECHWNYTAAARALNISVINLRNIVDQNDLIGDVDKASALQLLELAELKMLALINEGDVNMIRLVVEGKGHLKGWSTRSAPVNQTNIQVNNTKDSSESKNTIVFNGKEWEL